MIEYLFGDGKRHDHLDNEVRAARRIAEDIFVLGGSDLRGMPDAELLEHLRHVGTAMAEAAKKTGVSADEAEKALRFASGLSITPPPSTL